MTDIKKNFGKKLRYYREKQNLTQSELAERADINCRSLSFIECGVNFITAKTLDSLCKALNVSPKQLFDFEYCTESTENLRAYINKLLDNNTEKLNDIYKILQVLL